MGITRQGVIVTAALLASSAPAVAQQTLSGQPTVVRVEGLGEVLESLKRVEQKLELLLGSRWEYRSIQRNRLDTFGDGDNLTTTLGREGWELVNVTVEEGYIFKRRVLPR